MTAYTVAIVDNVAQAKQCPPLNIAIASWGCQYRPHTQARLAYVRNQGFLLHLYSEEVDPLRTFTQPDQPVHQDSCLEAFINFNPQQPQPGYINFEANANGALWCAVGTQRHGRQFVRQMGLDAPTPTVTCTPQGWAVEMMIPLALIRALYGDIAFEDGTRLRGNFYKCGDLTPNPHYLSWAPIHLPQPDFHTPDHFGTLVLRKLDK